MNMQAEAVEDDVVTTTAIDDDDGPAPGEDRGDDFTPTDEAPAAPAPAAAPAAAPAPAAEADKAQQQMIPKARFDEVNNDRKFYAEENARLKAELAAKSGAAPAAAEQATQEESEAVDIMALERQRIDAMMEGDTEKAAEIGAQIVGIVRQQARNEALQEMDERSTRSTTANLVNTAAAEVIAQYPMLDDASENANPEAIDELVALRNGYIAKGIAPAEAIKKAAEKVAKLYDLDAPQPTAEPKEPVVDPRTKQAIERGAHVAATQPNTAAVGVGTRQDTGRINIEAMSEEQFDALPETEKRRLRGD